MCIWGFFPLGLSFGMCFSDCLVDEARSLVGGSSKAGFVFLFTFPCLALCSL